MNTVPVIIFNYNRPDHSLQTWDALSRNQYAAELELYLYCDGPKANASDEMRQRIAELHAQAKQFAIEAPKAGQFKAVHVVCADVNKGLANSIIGGVSEVIEKHGRVIVLEDDLITSPYFLKYMNSALDKYESYPSVTISANRPPVNKMAIPADYEYDVFVSLRPFSTGWATWKDKWERIDWSLDYLGEFLTHPQQIKSFHHGGDDLTNMLLLQRDHKIDNWAIRYSFQLYYHHAVAILPYEPQCICRLSRKDLPEAYVKSSPITKYPLIQSAQWLIESMQTPDAETMYVMATNREAQFYDSRVHTFGIKIENEEPIFHELLALPYDGGVFYQYYPMEVKDNKILLMDMATHKSAFYELEKIK